MLPRSEAVCDASAIHALVTSAFRDAPHASGAEADIVSALRKDGALAVSLVAVEADQIVGFVAFSPVAIGGKTTDWFGLGPVAVARDFRRCGIGASLIRTGLDSLRSQGAGGCVVLGDPSYYARFGFVSNPVINYPGVPAKYFQHIRFRGAQPAGEVRYHRAFG